MTSEKDSAEALLEATLRSVAADKTNTTGTERMRAAFALRELREFKEETEALLEATLRSVAADKTNATGTERMRAASVLMALKEETTNPIRVAIRNIINGGTV